jgi:hypothetical protein
MAKNQTLVFIFWLAVIAAAVIIYLKHTAISDWWFLRNYTPPAQVQQLAAQADMTQTGRNVFYRAAPQIVTQRSEMVSHCSLSDNQVAELGCYTSNEHIYLLSITEPALSNEMIVTVAYEMLHPVYEHMSASQRKTIDAEMEAIVPQITDQSILGQMHIYAQTEPGARDEELYSILGTEYPDISPALAANYAQYLGNRDQLVAYHLAFEQTYNGLASQITQLGASIAATKAQMARYQALGEISRYNALVDGVNSQVDLYNAQVNEYNRYGSALFGAQSAATTQ